MTPLLVLHALATGPGPTSGADTARAAEPASAGDTASATASKARTWNVTTELSFTDVAGNRSLTLLSTRFSVHRLAATGPELRASSSVRYGRSDGQTAVADYALDSEIRLFPRRTVSPFLTLTGNRDDVRNIEIRLAAAAGADLNLVRDSAAKVSFGLALLQDYEAVTLPPGSLQPENATLTRFNLRLGSFVSLRPGVSLRQQVTLQPVARDLGDYLLTTETAMRVLLSRRLAFQTSFVFNRDTSPADGVLFRNDRTLTAGLVLDIR